MKVKAKQRRIDPCFRNGRFEKRKSTETVPAFHDYRGESISEPSAVIGSVQVYSPITVRTTTMNSLFFMIPHQKFERKNSPFRIPRVPCFATKKTPRFVTFRLLRFRVQPLLWKPPGQLHEPNGRQQRQLSHEKKEAPVSCLGNGVWGWDPYPVMWGFFHKNVRGWDRSNFFHAHLGECFEVATSCWLFLWNLWTYPFLFSDLSTIETVRGNHLFWKVDFPTFQATSLCLKAMMGLEDLIRTAFLGWRLVLFF